MTFEGPFRAKLLYDFMILWIVPTPLLAQVWAFKRPISLTFKAESAN